MWVAHGRFVELIRAEERCEMLRLRVNQLEGDLAHERHLRTGEPQRVAEFAAPRKKKPEPTIDEQSIAQIESGLEIFQDPDELVTLAGARVAI